MDADRGARKSTNAFETGRPDVRLVVMVRSELVRLGVSRLLHAAGMEVVGEARDLRAGIAVLREAAADVVLVESTPSSSALETLRAFVRSVPQRVVVVVGSGDDRSLLEALAAGARACVAADAPADDIVTAVRAAAHDELFVSPVLARRLARELGLTGERAGAPPPQLSPREHQVLELIARGWDNGQIAQELYLSPATVKHHIASIFAKLGVDNRVQAAVRAVREGLDRSD